MNLDERVGKRHITELRRIRLEVQEKGDSSDDESFIEELMSERDRKMNRLKSLQEWQQSNHVSNRQTNNHATATSSHSQQSSHTSISRDLPELPPLESSTSGRNNVQNDYLNHSGETGESLSDVDMEPTSSLPDLPALEEITKPLHSANNMITLEERQPNEPESNFFSLLRYFFCQVENQGNLFCTIKSIQANVEFSETCKVEKIFRR
jgi:hypothetical protein